MTAYNGFPFVIVVVFVCLLHTEYRVTTYFLLREVILKITESQGPDWPQPGIPVKGDDLEFLIFPPLPPEY